MGASKDPAGLVPRQMAANRLFEVMRGENFVPFTSSDLPEGRDRALANRLVTTSLRRHGHLTQIITKLLDRGLPKKSGQFEEVLRIGLTELLFLSEHADHSALFVAVEVLKRDKKGRHLHRLLNGVLRNAQRRADEFSDLPDEDLLPDWLAKKWQSAFGGEAIGAISGALLEGPALDLTLKTADAELINALGAKPLMGDSVRVGARDHSVADLPGYAEGQFWVQDGAAALPAQLIDLPKGSRVLDLCAAPGGKTAQLINKDYEVTAVDSDDKRLEVLRVNLKRLDMQAEVIVADAKTYKPDALFDAVLVDAPCSATGTLRRHPEVILGRKPADIAGRVALQRAILSQAFSCLKPGGILIYCTCSLELEEGEAQADWILSDESVLGATQKPIKASEIAGLPNQAVRNGYIRTVPGLTKVGDDAGEVDGFFVGRFVKN